MIVCSELSTLCTETVSSKVSLGMAVRRARQGFFQAGREARRGEAWRGGFGKWRRGEGLFYSGAGSTGCSSTHGPGFLARREARQITVSGEQASDFV